MLLTPTMMLARFERGAIDCPAVLEAFEVIVVRHGKEAVDHITGLLASLPTDRAGILVEIAGLIHASTVKDKRA